VLRLLLASAAVVSAVSADAPLASGGTASSAMVWVMTLYLLGRHRRHRDRALLRSSENVVGGAYSEW
jgi:hypothetical protein